MTTATKTKKANKESNGAISVTRKCMCGCGGLTKGGKFLPGHDAKLKGTLQKSFRSDKGLNVKQKELVKNLGWTHLMKPSNGKA